MPKLAGDSHDAYSYIAVRYAPNQSARSMCQRLMAQKSTLEKDADPQRDPYHKFFMGIV